MGAIQALAPSFGAVAPYNGSPGSISGDWVAPPPRNIHLYYITSGLIYSLIDGFLRKNHWSPESYQQNLNVTTVSTDGNLGSKKMALVGEFKFFSEFGWAETGATDWKQTKAGNQSQPPNLFQTDSSRFSSHFKKLKKDDPSPEEPESSLFSVSKPSSSIS
jgi:hypothetical protein